MTLERELPSEPFSLVFEEGVFVKSGQDTLRGDQYAIALALLDEGKVVLGVLACPNLPLATIGRNEQHSSSNEVGCLFFAKNGDGTYMQTLDGSTQTKVNVSAVDNLEEASFFESYEAAHSSHGLSSTIAEMMNSTVGGWNWKYLQFHNCNIGTKLSVKCGDSLTSFLNDYQVDGDVAPV
ncbi:hypothetical protein RYX36_021057 [Vicia faba]